MVKVIEARALITAHDQTGKAFTSLAKKIEDMSKAQARVNKAGSAEVQTMTRRIEAMQAKLGQIEGFRKLSRDLDQASIAMKRTAQEAARLKAGVDGTGRPIEATAREIARAARAADQAAEAFRRQGRAVLEARAGLSSANIPINNLAAAQKKLEDRVKGANAALERQKALEAAKPKIAPVPAAPHTTPGRLSALQGAGGLVGGVGVGYGAKAAYDRAIEFERSINNSQARGELTKEQADALRRNARDLGSRGLGFTAAKVSELQRAYVQAGFEKEAGALALPTMQFSLFGDVDPYKAADYTVSALSAYRVKPQTPQEAVAAATRYQDIIAKGSNMTRLGVDDFAQGFKFSAPLASALGISQEQLAAMIATQGQAGMTGSEAGVAVRSMLTRLVRPTADSRQVMAEMGLNFSDYARDSKPVSAGDLISGLRNQGIDASRMRDALPGVIAAAEKSGNDIATEVTQALISGLNVEGVQDKNKISRFVARYVSSLGENIDIDKLFSDLKAKGVTPGQISRIFDAKQGTRLNTIMLDDNYQRFERELRENSQGASARGATVINQGAVGAHNRLVSSFDNLILSLAESGVLDTVSKTLEALASGINSLAETNPKVLEFATYAGMATAALVPLGLALKGLSGVVGTLLAIPGVRALAPAATAVGGPAMAAAAASRLPLLTRAVPYVGTAMLAYDAIEASRGITSTEGWKYRTGTAFPGMTEIYEQSRRAQVERVRDPEAARGAAFMRIPDPTSVKATVEQPIPVNVTGKLEPVELKGQGQVSVTVKVDGGRVTGMSSSSSGHIGVNAGTALSEFPGASE